MRLSIANTSGCLSGSQRAIRSAKPLRRASSRRLRIRVPLAVNRKFAEKDVSANLRLTAKGTLMRNRLLEARRKGLADLMARWEPDKHPDVLAMLNRMVDSLVRDLPAPEQIHGPNYARSSVK